MTPSAFSIRPDRERLRSLRSSVRDQLTRWKLEGTMIERIVLVVDEMVGNSIDHGGAYRVDGHEVSVTLALEGKDLRVVFSDPDTPESTVRELQERLAGATAPPPLDAERGRGLFLIRRTMQDVAYGWAPEAGMTISGMVRGVAR